MKIIAMWRLYQNFALCLGFVVGLSGCVERGIVRSCPAYCPMYPLHTKPPYSDIIRAYSASLFTQRLCGEELYIAASEWQNAMSTGTPGRAYFWRVPEGIKGQVALGTSSQDRGTTCMNFAQSLYIHDFWQHSFGYACVAPNGLWHIMSETLLEQRSPLFPS